MQQIYVESYFKGFKKFYDDTKVFNHPKREVIEKRLKIISFFDKYGEEATKEAFKVSRSTVYLWKKKIKESGGRLISLVPKSKEPKNKRKRLTSKAVVQFILEYRKKHPQVCKESIKYALDEYCKEVGISTVSESTIGRIIKDLKEKKLLDDNKKISLCK